VYGYVGRTATVATATRLQNAEFGAKSAENGGFDPKNGENDPQNGENGLRTLGSGSGSQNETRFYLYTHTTFHMKLSGFFVVIIGENSAKYRFWGVFFGCFLVVLVFFVENWGNWVEILARFSIFLL
jgi:hypothetical protein